MTYRTSFFSARRVSGFTLIELMITVVVLSIIVAIAMPAYTQQMQKARRTDARNALLDIAGREERYLSVASSYSVLTTDVGYAGVWPQAVTNGYYQITSVQVPDPAYLGTGPSFIVTATAIGLQANDTACFTFTVNQTGQQVALTSGGAPNSATCWGI
jgi:type IV pilus assembly protein PilE